MKENKTNCGVYKIKNIENGKCYIGSSVNLWSRKNQHFNQLKQGNHGNRYLQNSYNLNGKDNFEWSILKYINKIEDKKLLKNELIEWENYYIGDYKNKNIKLYNIREIAESNLGIETRKKLEVINLDTLEIFDSSLEAGIKYSVHKYDVGKVCRGERITSKGYKWAYYEDYLNNNLKERKDLNKRSVINLDTEEIFDSIKDASSIYNICINNIWEACQNKRLHTGGYKWSYYKENMDIKNKINNIDDMLNKRKEKNKLNQV